MNIKERIFEAEAPTPENFGIHSRKGRSDSEASLSHSHDSGLEPSGKGHVFPFSRDLILRLINRIERT